MHLFNVLCDGMGGIYKALRSHSCPVNGFNENHCVSEFLAEQVAFFLKKSNTIFIWKNDKLWLFSLGYLADIFKNKWVCLSLQWKLSNNKIIGFK